MALVIEDIRVEVNQRTGRSWTLAQFTLALKAVLHDLAKEGLLKTRSSVTCAVGTANYAITDAKKLLYAQIYNTSDTDWSEPLDLITENEYREELAKNSSNSEPTKATLINGSIYVSPAPDSTNYTLYYAVTKRHADSTTIEYDEEYREGLIEGCCYKSYGLVGFPKASLAKAMMFKKLYEEEKEAYARQMGRGKISRVRYTDI